MDPLPPELSQPRGGGLIENALPIAMWPRGCNCKRSLLPAHPGGTDAVIVTDWMRGTTLGVRRPAKWAVAGFAGRGLASKG